ncbi:hypothetical protein PMKS-000506 [Pichia membranifaciens]|uniref:PIH1 N-terminal domain-containing protein n=1 Tax=Pichia membranifaciens TaxID=4926 RepID=A0A1Q2YBY2_9ASCO|nr:hypothetical protein PMKS-000506 [Pichia membranifaciens]
MSYIKEEREVNLEELVLTPYFVVKTKIFTPYKTYNSGTKFFINVCSNGKVPTKEIKNESGKLVDGFDAKLVFVLISRGEWEIPILTSPEIRETLDKKGNKALLIDCAINDLYIKWCMVNEELKDIVIQWCIDAVEFQAGGNFVIDRDSVSLPKRTCIGGNPQNIEVDLHHLKNISRELEELSKDIYEGTEDPLMLVNARRLDALEEEDSKANKEGVLPSLMPLGNPSKKANLIVELDTDENQNVKLASDKKTYTEEKSQKIRYEVSISKLPKSKTKLNHKYELKISSQLQHYTDYSLKFDKIAKDLIISDSSNDSVLKFPLPLDVTGEDITSFFVKKEKIIYVYII